MFLNSKITVLALSGCIVLQLAAPAQAATMFDQDVTNEVIMGTGIGNGGFTTDRESGVELGLRGKLRFNAAGNPEPTYNSNGAGTYTFQAGNTPFGFSFAQPPTTTPVWNFEWSINSDYDGSSNWNLDDLTYELKMDFDPSAGTNFQSFDPINVSNADHSIGTNATGMSAGAEATDAADYVDLIANNNLAQNSWNYEFFNSSSPWDAFDPNDTGTYDIMLTASYASNIVASSTIQVSIVPEPASVGLLCLGGLASLMCRRPKRCDRTHRKA